MDPEEFFRPAIEHGRWLERDGRPLVPPCNRLHLDDEKVQELLSLKLTEAFTGKLTMQTGGHEPVTMEEWRIYATRRAIDVCGGNKTAAARRLGINVKTIYNILPEYRQ